MTDPSRSTGMPGDERRERMQRIRVGLTGLAVVLLIVFAATALFNRVRDAQSPATNAAQASEAEKSSMDEPLADLGVAPGASENEAATAQPSAK
jgi:hypothetical protein